MGLALVGVAYTWGIPLIEKRADTSLVERTYKAFDANTNENSYVIYGGDSSRETKDGKLLSWSDLYDVPVL